MSRKPSLTVAVPFNYRVNYIANSWTNERTVAFEGVVDVVIDAVEPEEAPVAFLLRGHSQRDYVRNPYLAKADGSAREIRWYGNRFWAESGEVADVVAALRGRENLERHPFAEAVDRRSMNYVAPAPKPRERWERDRPAKTPSGTQDEASLRAFQEGIKRIDDDNGASVAAGIAKKAANCLVVDGRVFEMVPEPVLVIDGIYDGVHVGSVQDAGIEGHYGSSSDATFPLDRFADAKAFLDKKAWKTGEGVDTSVEILRPDLVFAGRDDGKVVRQADSIVRELKRHHASELPRGWIGKAAALGNAVDDDPRHVTPALARALKEFSELPGIDAATLAKMARLREDDAWEYGEKATNVSKSLSDAVESAAKLLPMALADLEREILSDRMDASRLTRASAEGFGDWRIRPCRRREDVRRAAILMGVPYEGLMERLEADASIDLALVERGHRGDAGDDMPYLGAVLAQVDGTVLESHGEIPGGVIDRHLAKAAAGRDAPTPQGGFAP